MRYSYIFLTLSLSVPMLSIAQEKNISDEQINVVKPYQPTLSEAIKVNSLPKGDSSTYELSSPVYEVTTKKITAEVELNPIKPIKLKDEPAAKLYKNYVKAGFGNYTTPYAELFMSSLQSKVYTYGAHLKHISSTGKISDVGYPGFSSNTAEVYGKRVLKKEILSGDIIYNREVAHYYGYNSNDTSLVTSDIRQKFNFIGLGAALTSNLSEKPEMPHNIKLDFYNFSDLYSAKENSFNLNGIINKDFSAGKSALEVNFNNTSNKRSDTSFNRSILNIIPQFTFENNEIWSLTLGLNGTYSSAEKRFFIFPKVSGTYSLVAKKLSGFAELGGGLRSITYKNIAGENPFINPKADLRTEKETYSINGGLKGSAGNFVSYMASIRYSEVTNSPFFVNDSSNKAFNKFALIYDDISVVIVHAEAGYNLQEKVRMIVKGDYFRYTMKTEKEPWHKPSFIGTLTTTYNLTRELQLKSDIFVLLHRHGKDPKGEAVELKNIIDINLGADYRISPTFSVFANLNNIAALRYEKWLNYPMQRFNAMGGLSYSF